MATVFPQGTVLNGFETATHAEHGTLHSLHVQVLLGAWDVVGAHDPDPLACADLKSTSYPVSMDIMQDCSGANDF